MPTAAQPHRFPLGAVSSLPESSGSSFAALLGILSDVSFIENSHAGPSGRNSSGHSSASGIAECRRSARTEGTSPLCRGHLFSLQCHFSSSLCNFSSGRQKFSFPWTYMRHLTLPPSFALVSSFMTLLMYHSLFVDIVTRHQFLYLWKPAGKASMQKETKTQAILNTNNLKNIFLHKQLGEKVK